MYTEMLLDGKQDVCHEILCLAEAFIKGIGQDKVDAMLHLLIWM